MVEFQDALTNSIRMSNNINIKFVLDYDITVQ